MSSGEMPSGSPNCAVRSTPSAAGECLEKIGFQINRTLSGQPKFLRIWVKVEREKVNGTAFI